MKLALASLALTVLAASAGATEYAAPAAVKCTGTEYDLIVKTKEIEVGEMAMEYEPTTVVLRKRTASGEGSLVFSSSGAGYDADDREYYYYTGESILDHAAEERLLLTVKKRRLGGHTAVIRPEKGKKMTFTRCKVYMDLPSGDLI